jgi:hypothetical protein
VWGAHRPPFSLLAYPSVFLVCVIASLCLSLSHSLRNAPASSFLSLQVARGRPAAAHCS